MTSEAVRAGVWLVVLAAIVLGLWYAGSRGRGSSRRVGAGTSGAVYDLLNEDKRKAIELIVEERAEARDPEDADGNLPDLSAGSEPRGT
jgi:galactokinase